MVNLNTFLIYSAQSIRLNGWVSAADGRLNQTISTSQDALARMAIGKVCEDVDTEVAQGALEWSKAICPTDRSPYLQNILDLVTTWRDIPERSTGLAASIIQAYTKAKPKEAKQKVALGDMTGIMELFDKAKKRLKHPAMLLSNDGYTIRINMAGENTKVPGSLNVTNNENYDYTTWYGRIVEGVFQPSMKANQPEGLVDLLKRFSADPAKLAAEHGKLTGKCCFCNKPLTDKRSTNVGYGETCASKWGLPWK